VELSPLLQRPLFGLLYQPRMMMDDHECRAIGRMLIDYIVHATMFQKLPCLLFIADLAFPFALTTVEVLSSETHVSFYETSLSHIPNYSILHGHRPQNLKSKG
jgi:hypothetical protein